MFRVTHCPSSGAQNPQLQPLILRTFLVAGRCVGSTMVEVDLGNRDEKLTTNHLSHSMARRQREN
jgi:hypothetical protein